MDEDQSVSNGPWASSVGKCRVHSTLYEKIIGFGKAESKGEDDGVPPAMAQIIGRMMEQDAK
ncbi:hypothetical protein pdam_00005933 [Pocillopora damicornis]|uniref:Uncharacterized protein n=1 Tax=Pocillopora damicornis TaxID=46731 RepID=A0A3M6TBN7_POCDA|nr:hypothetical protein pdam_00005933 [Pocillopora damicornis]